MFLTPVIDRQNGLGRLDRNESGLVSNLNYVVQSYVHSSHWERTDTQVKALESYLQHLVIDSTKAVGSHKTYQKPVLIGWNWNGGGYNANMMLNSAYFWFPQMTSTALEWVSAFWFWSVEHNLLEDPDLILIPMPAVCCSPLRCQRLPSEQHSRGTVW